MKPTDTTQNDALSWLLEPDPQNPAMRYFALRDLLDHTPDEPEVRQWRTASTGRCGLTWKRKASPVSG